MSRNGTEYTRPATRRRPQRCSACARTNVTYSEASDFVNAGVSPNSERFDDAPTWAIIP